MGLFGRKNKEKMENGLKKTRTGFWGNIVNALTGAEITDDLYDDLEEQLILADVGADVALRLVERLREAVKAQHLRTGDQAMDALREILREEMEPAGEMDLSGRPAVILVIGVNGVGKTTSIAKLAHYYREQGRRVMLAAGDTFRAAASEQLDIWAGRAGVPIVKAGEGADPAAVIFDTVKSAEARGYDMVIADTAGRLHIDTELMAELQRVKEAVEVDEVLLVIDSMTGQDAVNVAQTFNDTLGIDGVILTKLDGDTRGGAALSIRAVTGKPILYVGMGEKLSDLEQFYPDRMASRILGMGDVLSLIDKAQQAVSQEEAAKFAKKLKEQSFDLNDYLAQFENLKKMGDIKDIVGMLPGAGKMKISEKDIDEKEIARFKAIIQSMTPKERADCRILNYTRKKRIAAGSGTSVQDVNKLVKQFEQTKELMKRFGKSGKKGMKLPF